MEPKKSNYYLSWEEQRTCFPPEAASATSCLPVPDVVPAVQILVYTGVHPLQYSFSFLAMTLSSLGDAFISCSLLDLTKCSRCPTSDAFEVSVVAKFHTFSRLLLTTFSIIFSWTGLTGFHISLAKVFAAGYGIIIPFSPWLRACLIISCNET